MHKTTLNSETCPITEALDKRRTFQSVLYTVTGDALQLEVASLTMLDNCVDCQYGKKRDLTISKGITKIKCLKWGSFSEL